MALGCLAIFLALPLVKSFESQVVIGFNLGFFEVFNGLTVLVLGKFGLVQFEALFAKLETKPFGFSQIFRNRNRNCIKLFDTVSNGFKPGLNRNHLRKKLFVIIYLRYIIS